MNKWTWQVPRWNVGNAWEWRRKQTAETIVEIMSWEIHLCSSSLLGSSGEAGLLGEAKNAHTCKAFTLLQTLLQHSTVTFLITSVVHTHKHSRILHSLHILRTDACVASATARRASNTNSFHDSMVLHIVSRSHLLQRRGPSVFSSSHTERGSRLAVLRNSKSFAVEYWAVPSHTHGYTGRKNTGKKERHANSDKWLRPS